MAWTSAEWDSAAVRWRLAYQARDTAAAAIGSLDESVRDRISTAGGAPGQELVRRGQNLGQSPELHGYEVAARLPVDELRTSTRPEDAAARRELAEAERSATIALSNADRFLDQFRTVDAQLRDRLQSGDMAALEAAGWRNARDLARAPDLLPEQAPIAVTARPARRSRLSVWAIVLPLVGLLLSSRRR